MSHRSFSITVKCGPDNPGSWHGLQFASEVLQQGHAIKQVFFYGDGVLNCTTHQSPPQDEPNLPSRWAALVQTHQLQAIVCIAAAIRRGVYDGQEATRHSASANLAAGFELSGLGQLIAANASSDLCVSFG